MATCQYCNASNQASGGFCAVCMAPIEGELATTSNEEIEVIDAETLAGLDLPRKEPVIEGFVTPGLGIIAGRPKAGKSWIVAHMANCVATGTPWNGAKVAQGVVIYLALEDAMQRLQDRQRRLTLTPSPNLLLATSKGNGFDSVEQLIENRQPKMLVIDTWQKFHDGKAPSYARDYEASGRLKTMADKHGVAIVIVHHTVKIKMASPLDSVSGSTGLTGCADTISVLVSGPEGVGEGTKGALWTTGRDVPSSTTPLAWTNGRWLSPNRQKAKAIGHQLDTTPTVWAWGQCADERLLYLRSDKTGPELGRNILKSHKCVVTGPEMRMSEAELLNQPGWQRFKSTRLRDWETEADLRRHGVWQHAGQLPVI